MDQISVGEVINPRPYFMTQSCMNILMTITFHILMFILLKLMYKTEIPISGLVKRKYT